MVFRVLLCCIAYDYVRANFLYIMNYLIILKTNYERAEPGWWRE